MTKSAAAAKLKVHTNAPSMLSVHRAVIRVLVTLPCAFSEKKQINT